MLYGSIVVFITIKKPNTITANIPNLSTNFPKPLFFITTHYSLLMPYGPESGDPDPEYDRHLILCIIPYGKSVRRMFVFKSFPAARAGYTLYLRIKGALLFCKCLNKIFTVLCRP